MEISFRIPQGTSEEEEREVQTHIKQAYKTYAASIPHPRSRFHTPPLCLDLFRSEHPFTEHGKLRGLLWLPEGKALDEWTQGAADAVMRAFREKFPEHGLAVRFSEEGNTLKLRPMVVAQIA